MKNKHRKKKHSNIFIDAKKYIQSKLKKYGIGHCLILYPLKILWFCFLYYVVFSIVVPKLPIYFPSGLIQLLMAVYFLISTKWADFVGYIIWGEFLDSVSIKMLYIWYILLLLMFNGIIFIPGLIYQLKLLKSNAKKQ